MKRGSLWLLAIVVVLGTWALGCRAPEPAAEIEAATGCTDDGDCAVGSICEDGSCEEAVCPDVYDPVCGVDGRSYSNACEARAAHVEVAHPGECPLVCGGVDGALCPEGQLCDLPAGMCRGADLQGVCVQRPEACTEIYDPVCGCDGTTYSNDCFRLMAGAQLDHAGECSVG